MNPVSAPEKRHVRGGFTLLELLAVVGIILVLAALMVPAVGSIKEAGKRNVCMAHMREVSNIVLRYSADHGNRILPVASGANAWMNDNVWYELLDAEGYLIADPAKGGECWSGKRNGIMSCPSRDAAAFSYWSTQRHDLHYCLNQHPGFLNRVNTSEGGWPTLAKIPHPSRAFMLAEATFPVGYPNGDNLVYPHPRKGRDLAEGGGMNLVFYDGTRNISKEEFPTFGQVILIRFPTKPSLPKTAFRGSRRFRDSIRIAELFVIPTSFHA